MPTGFDQRVGISVTPPFLYPPGDEELLANVAKAWDAWQRNHGSIRRLRPHVKLGSGRGGDVRVEQIFIRNKCFYYFVRLPTGGRLRVWPWRTFRTPDRQDAEYMRMKVEALLNGEDPPPIDDDYRHFDPEEYRLAYEEWVSGLAQ